MDTGFVQIIKVKYDFKDGNSLTGLELNLAPKVKKFIPMTRDNLDLLKMMGNGISDWYNRAEFGDDIVAKCYTGQDKIVSASETSGPVAVHFN